MKFCEKNADRKMSNDIGFWIALVILALAAWKVIDVAGCLLGMVGRCFIQN